MKLLNDGGTMAAQRAGEDRYKGAHARRWGVAMACVLSGLWACGAAPDDSKLPPNVQDPAVLRTPSGSVARYRGALSHLSGALDRVIIASAIITDELAGLPASRGVGTVYTPADSRLNLSGFSDLNSKKLHRLRAQAREARGFLAAYAPDSSPALQGHMYAVEAYAEVFLADLFCSGIPLSTVEFDGNYTLAEGSTTNAVYRHAIALFDSALTVSGDSVSVQRLAAVGKGRALLALGEYAAAAAAVSAVPDDYVYQVKFNYGPFSSAALETDSAALWLFLVAYPTAPGIPTVADREGRNGLDYRSSGDPRTWSDSMGADALNNPAYFPRKYSQSSPATYTMASGIEARLIEAEAALQASLDDGVWLAKLNALRQTVGLADTTDPGGAAARVDLLFRERAFWLYLDGHRQGDLRRLIRNYPDRSEDRVYPTGIYPGGDGHYGTEIVIPTPISEHELNPKYTGCMHQGA